MSEWGVLVPVAAITVGPIAWAFNNWTRAKHGQPMERFEGEFEKRGAEEDRMIASLTNENEALHGKVSRLEERIAVLERIATDPAERTARAIEALR